jgi:hypothetical protein
MQNIRKEACGVPRGQVQLILGWEGAFTWNLLSHRPPIWHTSKFRPRLHRYIRLLSTFHKSCSRTTLTAPTMRSSLLLPLVAYSAFSHARVLDASDSDATTTVTVTELSTQTVTTGSPWATESPYFSAFAFLPGSPFHLQCLAARDFQFWIGGGTASYCPEVVDDLDGCPTTNYTGLTECIMVSL